MILIPRYKIVIDCTFILKRIVMQSGDLTDAFESEEQIELINIIDYTIEENLNMFTDNLTIRIPLANFNLNKDGLDYMIDDNTYRINQGNKISLFQGYENMSFNSILGEYTMIESYKGYIKDYQMKDNVITITCENEMYNLKKGNSIKRSYPSPVQQGIIDNLNPNIYVGKDFMLHHFIYNIFGYEKTVTERQNIPYDILTYPDYTLGKLRLNVKFQISEILEHLKKKYGIYVYFRLVPDKIEKNILYQKTVLYIGYKYWNDSAYIDVTKAIRTGNTLQTQMKNWNKICSFSYPFDENYNRIIENDLQWVNTNKEELIVTFKSVQDKTSELITYTYPENKTELIDLLAKQKLHDLEVEEATKKTGNVKTAKKIVKEKEDARKAIDKEIKEYIVFSENNANLISIDIPNMDLNTMKTVCKKKYDEYTESGYQGSITTFGEPYVNKGDIVQIKMTNTKLMEGNNLNTEMYSYYVDKVRRTFTKEGIRQNITIGNRYYSPKYQQALDNKIL